MKKFNDFLIEDLGGALVEPASGASAQAKKLGLQYVGFGRYEDPNTQQITHVVQNERLVPFSKAIKSNTFKASSKDDYGTYTKQMMPEIEQMQNYLVDYYKPENFKDEELSAIEDYTAESFYDVNQKLYTLPTGIKAKDIQPETEYDDLPQLIGNLDSSLEKMKTPVEFLSYVGLGTNYNITDFVPGKVFGFKGYRSTTINPNIALNYNSRVNKDLHRKQTVMLQIRIPKGSKGLFVEDFSANPGESEFLLPRGSKVKVIGGPNKLVGSNAYTGDSGLEVLYFDCILVK
jgi:hypothetical protein